MMNELSRRVPLIPSAAAERMRLHRERRRQGLQCIIVELRETEIDGLVRLGFLSAETRNDVMAIRKGLYQYFETMLDSNRDAQQA